MVAEHPLKFRRECWEEWTEFAAPVALDHVGDYSFILPKACVVYYFRKYSMKDMIVGSVFCPTPWKHATESFCACVCTLLQRVLAKIGWKNFICVSCVHRSSEAEFCLT
jgi:hypothetical protein